MSSTLTVQGVSKHFGGVEVLTDVSLTAEPGKVTALIGPNGAGKSTLANIVSGFIPPSGGRVLLDDADITGRAVHDRAALGIGRTFQNLEVFVGMTVLDNVLMGTYPSGHSGYLQAMLGSRGVRREEREMRARALDMLTEWGLAQLAGRRVEELAFGEAKLVELARVLAMQPRVVVMDEPAAGLPPSAAREVGERIAELAHRGLTLLLIEHNMQLVMEISDLVLVLDHGQMIAEGPPETVRQDQQVITAYLGEDVEGISYQPGDVGGDPAASGEAW